MSINSINGANTSKATFFRNKDGKINGKTACTIGGLASGLTIAGADALATSIAVKSKGELGKLAFKSFVKPYIPKILAAYLLVPAAIGLGVGALVDYTKKKKTENEAKLDKQA